MLLNTERHNIIFERLQEALSVLLLEVQKRCFRLSCIWLLRRCYIGVEGDRTERELLLDDIIQQQNEHRENKCNKRNKRAEMERKLQSAGERLWTAAAAVQRVSTVSESDDGYDDSEVSFLITPRSANGRYKRRRQVVMLTGRKRSANK